MRDKSHFSFLIAFTRQLEEAITSSVTDDVSDTVDTLGDLLGVLVERSGGDAGFDDGGLPESVVDDDAPGDDTPLGAALRRIADLESAAALVDKSQQRRTVGCTDAGQPDAVGSQRRGSPVLKKGARRGKK